MVRCCLRAIIPVVEPFRARKVVDVSSLTASPSQSCFRGRVTECDEKEECIHASLSFIIVLFNIIGVWRSYDVMMFRVPLRLKFTKQPAPWLTENEMREFIPPNWELNHSALLGLNLRSQFSFIDPDRARLFLSEIHALEDEEKVYNNSIICFCSTFAASCTYNSHPKQTIRRRRRPLDPPCTTACWRDSTRCPHGCTDRTAIRGQGLLCRRNTRTRDFTPAYSQRRREKSVGSVR